MNVEKVYVGGWFQRTMLQLSELYDFFREGISGLNLDPNKLYDLHKELQIKTIEYGMDNMEYIKLTTTIGINIKFVEDGLIVLNCDTNEDNIFNDVGRIASYYEKCLSPAISYLFHIGAPVPKELINIDTIYPYFIVFNKTDKKHIYNLIDKTEKTKYFEFSNDSYDIIRGDRYYFVNNKKKDITHVERYIEEQIFIKEFKEQLHRYLNIHRVIWERIDEVKSNETIKGKDIIKVSSQIDGYRKTVNLIDSRINQMDTYIRTREKIAKNDKELCASLELLEYRYENLINTLDYIKDIWDMTKNYLDQSEKLFYSLGNQVTEKSVKNLTIITAMSLGASVWTLFRKQELSYIGFILLIFIILVGVIVSYVIKTLSENKTYQITDVNYDKNIK